MNYNFDVRKTITPKQKPNPDNLMFGRVFTDHMFVMDYNPEKGWHNGHIVPYGPIPLDPAAAVLHYGQEFFEGMKAYRTPSGDVQLFRPFNNAERINSSADRMCMPKMDTELYVSAIKALVDLERDWIPEREGTSLYIRPFIIATDPFLGVRASDTYRFIIICSPVGPYYNTPTGGILPTKIYVEEEYVRAVVGGVGAAKTGGNYASSLKALRLAMQEGCDQVLWLDAIEHSFVEEIGNSNAFFVIDDEVITPPLLGTILPGVTRDSVITLLRKWGIKISERKIRISEVVKASQEGRLKEAFGTGTAAVIAPVGTFVFKDDSITVGNGGVGELALKLYNTLYGIQTGTIKDDMGWVEKV